MIDISKELIDNHHLYKRDFLWRHTSNPYEIMIAEFMLQRTKAEQVAPVYENFLSEFPDIKSLAMAELNEVSIIIHPLGLHWRSVHFIESCKYLEKEHDGIFPDTRKDLLKIPGVGDYVAGVILAICYKKTDYVVDSNIARFLNRYYRLNLSGEMRRNKDIIKYAKKLFECRNPDNLLFSILDFTSLVCKPLNPDCSNCHLSGVCMFARAKKI